jgi:Glyoxalase/Bleomycin resistance protein/Dioxygenase superfamily
VARGRASKKTPLSRPDRHACQPRRFARQIRPYARRNGMRYLHTMVRISDIEKSLNFYCDVLGLVEVRRVESQQGRFTLIFLAAPEDAEAARENRAP